MTAVTWVGVDFPEPALEAVSIDFNVILVLTTLHSRFHAHGYRVRIVAVALTGLRRHSQSANGRLGRLQR
jgi:hypothetical protein